MTVEQIKALDEAGQAARSCSQRAEKCASLGLLVLAREYDAFAKSLTQAIQWQKRAIDGPSVFTQPANSEVIEQ